MFKIILNGLISFRKDELYRRISEDKNAQKQWDSLGGAIFFSLLSLAVLMFSLTIYKDESKRPSFSVNNKNEVSQIITLPYPHQSIKNVQSWLVEAIMSSYTFSFSDYDNQIEKAEFFFLPDGYKAYLASLSANKMRQEVIGNNLKISAIPTAQPVSINNGMFGNTEFWRFRVPVVVSFYGGKEVINQKYMVETLVLRIPSHMNYRALGISEFNMVQI